MNGCVCVCVCSCHAHWVVATSTCVSYVLLSCGPGAFIIYCFVVMLALPTPRVLKPRAGIVLGLLLSELASVISSI